MLTFQYLIESFEGKLEQEIQALRSARPLQLYEPIAYSLQVGGKRIRPVLLLHAASLFSEETDSLYPAALAIELFHNFTLLHDDIMDHAEIRRGIPSVHVRYGANSAILSGDAMSIMAFQYLSKSNSPGVPASLALFSRTALEVCEGQQLDMEFEKRERVSIDEYLEMIRLKTAVLIGCSLMTGALLAGAQETECRLLYDFGIQTGLAFQLQDDWLDVYGDEKSFGKKIGGDILENKKTYILLKAFEMGDAHARSMLKKWMERTDFDPEEKVEAVREIYTSCGASEATRNLMESYHNNALLSLNRLNIRDSDKNELRIFAGRVLSRIR